MAKAKLVAQAVPGWAEQVEAIQAEKARVASFKGKTFESLTGEERNDLLKAVAIRLQLIVPS